ncbi:MAG: stage II sporulation protein M [Anaerolineae bacterium]|nr:stage II sporulation protein M [Anaerolineae bacterium]
MGRVWLPISPFPMGVFRLDSVSGETFADIPEVAGLPLSQFWGVLSNNMRSLLFAAFVVVFSYGVMAVALLMIPMAVIFFFAVQATHGGYSPGLFLLAYVLPRGLLELPAAITATALAVRLGAAFMARHRGVSVREEWLWALADLVKVFAAVVLPLLAIAAVVEIHVTPSSGCLVPSGGRQAGYCS